MAAPRPSAARFGTWSGPERPSSARPSAQASAMWPRVLAPASPKSAASGAPPKPTESITRGWRGASGDPLDGCSGASGGGGVAEAVGGARPARVAAASAVLARGVDARERVSGSTAAPRPSRLVEPDGVVDRVGRPPPAAAERDHREAERAGVDGGDEARRARRCTSPMTGAPARCASKSSTKSAGPPSAATMRSKRSAAAPDSKATRMRSAPSPASSGEAGRGQRPRRRARRSRPRAGVDRVAAQEAGGVRDLERVAGGAWRAARSCR